MSGVAAKLTGVRIVVKNNSGGGTMGEDVINVTGPEPRVAELVRSCLNGLSPAERKLARVLLASYPIAGLESVARFAERAKVSPPTGTRFITKLGVRGSPEVQATPPAEMEA